MYSSLVGYYVIITMRNAVGIEDRVAAGDEMTDDRPMLSVIDSQYTSDLRMVLDRP